MSDEHKDLTGENVHGIKNTWQRFGSWDEKVAEPEPAAEEPAPAPEPAPEPAPAPVEAGPHQKKAARKMAASLGMSREECLKQIMADPELFKTYGS